MTDAPLNAPLVPEPQSTATVVPEKMAWDSRARRVVTIYLPLACFVIILLFPFYWMAITAFKPNAELYDYKTYNPFWIGSPTLEHIYKLLFQTAYPRWLLTTMGVALCATVLSLFSSVLAAYALQRLRFRGSQYVGLGIYLAYLVPPSILFIPLATTVYQFGLFDTPLALILTYPTFLVPFCTWLLIGYFKSIPYELEECALIDGATRLQILRRITLPLAARSTRRSAGTCWSSRDRSRRSPRRHRASATVDLSVRRSCRSGCRRARATRRETQPTEKACA